ncbi:uncharacterized protein METZ01_LOCUS432758, partial [marine metagenome]
MLFSDKINANVKKHKRKSSDNSKFAEDSIDLSGLENIPNYHVNRLVTVSGEKVPLRRGP